MILEEINIKEKIKKVIVVMLVISVFLVNGVVVSAEEKENNSMDVFEEFCKEYYSSYEEYIVWNIELEDISSNFYFSTVDFYNAGEIQKIYEYAKSNVFRFQKNLEEENISTYGAIQNETVSRWFYQMVTSGKYCPDYEIQYTLTGNFSYNANTGKITSYSSPTLELVHCTLNGVWSGSMISASTQAKVATDNYSVTFSGNFKMKTSCSVPIGDIAIPDAVETHGPFEATLIAYGS